MTPYPLVGRTAEQQVLHQTLRSPGAELVAIVGRRRVGKTFLVKSFFQQQLDFEITGIQHASRSEQLRNFSFQMARLGGFSALGPEPRDWLDAFFQLSQALENKPKEGKWVVFLDELPWLATHGSGFLKGLSWFWNSWAVNQPVVVVICGSAASWMIKHVVNHKGGLHNRITRRIHLQPFTLAETEAFFESRHIQFDRYQLAHLYMVLGGVPLYLNEVTGGRSAAQNIEAICFSPNGLLRDEFPKLFAALFESPKTHLAIVKALATRKKGLTYTEIAHTTGLSDGGSLSTVLEELLHSDFISRIAPFEKKKKDRLYRLTDEFSLFYLQFMEPYLERGVEQWQQLAKEQGFVSWSGYAFENMCLKHLPSIKQALGISGVLTQAGSYIQRGTDSQPGLQVDLLLERSDHVIHVFELKFYAGEFSLTKEEALRLRNRVAAFKEATGTRKQVWLTLITPFGLRHNAHSLGLVDSQLTLDALFRQV
ncbi:MAG: ATP-binding protein [Bacteroidia bacterium]|nr:ATP-binding protein [Bacteroidia bacterium]